MKKTTLAVAAGTIAIFLMAYQQQKRQADPTSKITSQHSMEVVEDTTKKIKLTEKDLASKKDLVCGMPAFRFMKDTTTFKKKIYAFCSKECKDEFLKTPKSFIKK